MLEDTSFCYTFTQDACTTGVPFGIASVLCAPCCEQTGCVVLAVIVFVTAPHCLRIRTHNEEVPFDEQRLSDYWLPWTRQLQALTPTGVNAADDEALPEG